MCNCNTSKTSFKAELKKATRWQNKTGSDYGVYFDTKGNPYALIVDRIMQLRETCCYYVPTNFDLSKFNGEEFKKIHK